VATGNRSERQVGMLFAFFEPVGPTASSLVERQKAFIAFTVQFSCDDILGPDSPSQSQFPDALVSVLVVGDSLTDVAGEP